MWGQETGLDERARSDEAGGDKERYAATESRMSYPRCLAPTPGACTCVRVHIREVRMQLDEGVG
jgi:hypothetical protein